MVKTNPHVHIAKRFHHGPEQVTTGGGVRGLVLRQLGVPQAEAFMMLGRHHKVLHAGPGGCRGPEFGIVEVGIEPVEILLIRCGVDALKVFQPFMPGPQGIEAPMDEEAETIMGEPCGIAGGRLRQLRHLLIYSS